jgi:hypothetical protein
MRRIFAAFVVLLTGGGRRPSRSASQQVQAGIPNRFHSQIDIE